MWEDLGVEGMQDTTYPREGTETLSPCKNIVNVHDTTYPREGTETHRRR